MQQEKNSYDHFVVGIGASAGGLESLQRCFARIPDDLGMAYVVVQHLSPDFESVMDELLAKHTKMSVKHVSDGLRVKPNHVYLIPPAKEMIVSQGKFCLKDRDREESLSLPIDAFFRSLAVDAGSNAIGVVLSGTGSDGSRGVIAIAEAGGLVLAESEDSAKFSGMPRSAVGTGVVDKVLPSHEIGRALRNYVMLPELLDEQNVTEDKAPSDLERVFDLLQMRSGLDFGNYKKTTVARRVNRRMLLQHDANLAAYIERLEEDPEEIELLRQDLLIGVTRFFRDENAFQALRKVLEEQIKALQPEEEFRVWTPGCASGEEAYSIAILVHEIFNKLEKPVRLKLFATDVHDGALRRAQRGIYPASSLDSVPEHIREKYFSGHQNKFAIDADVRSSIVFARHDILRDAPFTKLDLVSCRNLLIYFNKKAHQRVLTVCHFALRSSGVLFLGASETPAGLADEFTTIDSRRKLYRKRRDVRLLPHAEMISLPYGRSDEKSSPRLSTDETTDVAERKLISEFGPPALLVSPDHDVMHTFSGGSKFLRQTEGRASLNVLSLLEGDAKYAVSACLSRVSQFGDTTVFRAVRIGSHIYDIHASPLEKDGSSTPILIAFAQVVTSEETTKKLEQELEVTDLAAQRISDLEGQLSQTRENLQTTLEEMEASNEELQATNEELMAANEELQSTNEELQSVNEELFTVNAEYDNKIKELDEVTADLRNLLESAEVHVLYLDAELRIRRFTKGVAAVFDLRDSDEGRPLRSFSHSLLDIDIISELSKVLNSGEESEQVVTTASNTKYLLRILPYKQEKMVNGVLMTLTDVSDIEAAQREQSQLHEIVDATSDFIGTASIDGKVLSVNHGGRAMLGLDDDEPLPERIVDCHPKEIADLIMEIGMPEAIENGHWVSHTAVKTKDGGRVPVSQLIIAHKGAGGEVAYLSTIMRDISDLEDAVTELREADRRKNEFLAILAHELRNPLQTMRMSLDLVEHGGADFAEEVEKTLGNQLNQLAGLIDDLTDVSRITRGKIKLNMETLSLSDLIGQIMGNIHGQIGDHRKIEVDVEPDVYVLGDHVRLEQILLNLLTNADRYSERGTPIKIKLEKRDSDAVVSVVDEGIGIEEEDLDVIFEPFFQADKISSPGLGVGLTLIRHLARLHGGDVYAFSDGEGKGSRFEVRLPAADADGVGLKSSTNYAVQSIEGKVLVVDDNHAAREAMVQLLKMKGVNAIGAGTGQEGIDQATKHKPTLALIDIGLPDMTGHEVAVAVRQALGDKVTMIALSGFDQAEVKNQARKVGFAAYLSKPARISDIEYTLGKLAENPGFSDADSEE